MVIEFMHHGKTYQFATTDDAPKPTIKVPFRPCVLKPAFHLELMHIGTDDVRMIEIYKPIREAHQR